jgi:signal transduction histidine kinase
MTMNVAIVSKLQILKAGMVSIGIGLLGMLGWIFNIEWLKSFLFQPTSMKVNTALSIILSGASLCLWCWQSQSLPRKHKTILRSLIAILSLTICGIALLTLTEYASGGDFGIDQFLLHQPSPPGNDQISGRMSPNTATALLCIGLALFCTIAAHACLMITQGFALGAWILGLIGLMAHLHSTAYPSSTLPIHGGMAFHTTIAILVLSTGILFTQTDRGFMRFFTASGVGSQICRKTLPLAIGLPIAIATISSIGYRLHFYSQDTEAALTNTLDILMFVGLISWNGTKLNTLEHHRHQTEAHLQESEERYQVEQMKTEFVGIVSHELRTPLTSMQAALSLLSEKILDPSSPDGEAAIQIASQGVDRLARLVNDILDLERLEFDKICLKKCPCDATALLTTAVEQMQEMANRAEITLTILSPQSLALYADPDRLVQVLTNLLSNAIKFSSPGSTVWLNAQPDPHTEDAVLFRVKDQGSGIPADQLTSIFERFHQVNTSDARAKGGTGLGLAICRSIIEQHGGKIWATSRLQQGSTFCFTISSVREFY